MRRSNPDLWLWLGDNAYSDGTSMTYKREKWVQSWVFHKWFQVWWVYVGEERPQLVFSHVYSTVQENDGKSMTYKRTKWLRDFSFRTMFLRIVIPHENRRVIFSSEVQRGTGRVALRRRGSCCWGTQVTKRYKIWNCEEKTPSANLLVRIPVMATWDDHDYASNNQGNDYNCLK